MTFGSGSRSAAAKKAWITRRANGGGSRAALDHVAADYRARSKYQKLSAKTKEKLASGSTYDKSHTGVSRRYATNFGMGAVRRGGGGQSVGHLRGSTIYKAMVRSRLGKLRALAPVAIAANRATTAGAKVAKKAFSAGRRLGRSLDRKAIRFVRAHPKVFGTTTATRFIG